MSSYLRLTSWCLAGLLAGLAWGSEVAAVALVGAAVLGSLRRGPRGLFDVVAGALIFGAFYIFAPDKPPVVDRWSAFAVATAAVGAFRPRGDAGQGPVDFSLLVLSLVGSGSGLLGPVYPVGGALAVVCFLAADTRAPRRRPLIPIALTACVLAAGLVWSLPKLQRRIIEAFAQADGRTAGFSTSMRLGSFRQSGPSAAAALRVQGDEVDYLRGQVYLRYMGGQWLTTDAPDTVMSRPGTAGRVLVTPLVDMPVHFVPLNARVRSVQQKTVRTDRTGTWRAPAGEDAGWVRFDLESVTLPPPEDMALNVPRRMQDRLHTLAKEWTQGETTPRLQMDRMQAKLRTFEYTLESGPQVPEPLMHFLFERKSGHCEYYASALALLGRTLGIPTRVATGYRVRERNAFYDFQIARQRDAHAWTEAWVDGGWRRYDATPAGLAFPPPSSLTQAWEALSVALAESSGARGVLAGVVAMLVFFLWWGRRRRAVVDDLPPFLAAYLKALAGKGYERKPGEPLGTFCKSLPQEWAAPLRAYVDWCFGEYGQRDEIERGLIEARRRLG